MDEKQHNEPRGQNDVVDSKESEKDSDPEGSRRREMPMAKFKAKVREVRLTIATKVKISRTEIVRRRMSQSRLI